ncbi:unnamed protein product, partial [Ectocarpus sp. 12 AP-2014]
MVAGKRWATAPPGASRGVSEALASSFSPEATAADCGGGEEEERGGASRPMSSRREDEADRSILGVLSKTTGSFQRELQALTTDLFSSVESGSAPTNGGGGEGTAAQRQRGGPGESSLGRVA